MTEHTAETDGFPSASDILRERLVDELIDHGMCTDEAEIVADQTVEFARARAAELVSPPGVNGATDA